MDQDSRSLPEAFFRTARSAPDRPFIRFEGRGSSYGDLAAEVTHAAGCLHGWGLGRGDRVALFLGNSPGFVVAYLAVLALGGVVVPVNTRYRASELDHMLADSGSRLLVTDAAGAGVLAGFGDRAVALERVLELSEDPAEDRLRWLTLAASTPPGQLPVRDLGNEDLAAIAYTSGTTGRSKGAMLSHGNFLSNSRAVTRAWRWTEADRLLLVLPLFHMHGLGVGLHGTLVQGSRLHLGRRFDAEDVYRTLCAGACTMFFGVPTMYQRLVAVARREGVRPQGLRLLVSGSAPLSPQTHAEVERWLGLAILERYGMTETVMNTGNPFAGPRRPGTVGLPFEGVEVRIADPLGQRLGAGQTGEVQLRGANICHGYWQRPEATAEAWTADGWYRTGDLGFLDGDGYLTLTGRAKELIITGGFNVYPREVEEVIAELEGVEEVAVLGRPDPDLGEKVVAVVVGPAETGAILDHCSARMAGFKKPRTVIRVAALPRNALGKVQKHLLREQLEEAPGDT